eukprot:1857631-Amphidinium_carterae.1
MLEGRGIHAQALPPYLFRGTCASAEACAAYRSALVAVKTSLASANYDVVDGNEYEFDLVAAI